MNSLLSGTALGTRMSGPEPCPRCAHVALDASWGPPWDLTHCRKCHRDWRMGSPQCHCTLCCAHFSNHRAADMHITPTGCRAPAEAVTKNGEPRLVLGRDRFGPIWRLAGRNPWTRRTARVPGAPQPFTAQPAEAGAGPGGAQEHCGLPERGAA